jgi:phage gp36-like protein
MSSYYTTQAAINGEIQMADLISLCDDNGTGMLDANATAILNQVIANASGEVDQACANIYGTQLPFSPVPLSVANMALTITCYRLYRRRSVPDEQNKFYRDYSRVRDFLDEVNTGDKHLDDVPVRDYPQGALTGQPVLYSGGPFGSPLSNSM